MILFRYISREFITNILAIFFILTIIAMIGQLVQLLNKAVAGQFSIVEMLLLWITLSPTSFAITFPIAVFFAGFLIVSRLHNEQEMAVIESIGISKWKIICYLLTVGAVLALLVSWLALSLNPKLIRISINRLSEYQKNIGLQNLPVGEFYKVNNETTLYAEKRENDQMKRVKILIEKPSWSKQFQIISAQLLVQTNIQGITFWVLKNGEIITHNTKQDIPENKKQITRTKFKEFYMKNPTITELIGTSMVESKTLTELSKEMKTNLKAKRELHWRISQIIQVLVAIIMSVPFGMIQPRQDRMRNFIPALITYIAYIGLTFKGMEYIQSVGGVIPLYMNHIFFSFLAVALCIFSPSVIVREVMLELRAMLFIRFQGLRKKINSEENK